MSRTTAWRRCRQGAHNEDDQELHLQERERLLREPGHAIVEPVAGVVEGENIADVEQQIDLPISLDGSFNDAQSDHSSGRSVRVSVHSSNESIANSTNDQMGSDNEMPNRTRTPSDMQLRPSDSSSDGSYCNMESDSSSSTSSDSSDVDSENDLEEWDGDVGNNANIAQPALVEQQNNGGNNIGDHWLYEGSRLTKSESDILIISFIIRWGLEEKSIEHLLQLINCHLPVPVLGSQYLFLKNFPIPDQLKTIFTCPKCLGLVREFDYDGVDECNTCHENFNRNKLQEDGRYFVQLSIAEQIRNILSNNTLFRLLRKECEESDVISGIYYRSLRNAGIIGENDLTLQWNTDSLSPYKSAKMQVWPILACVNELPYHARRENMILCGLYFGKTKPNVNSFLEPFVDNLEYLHNIGIQVAFPGQNFQTTVKVHTLLASVDSVARPVLQGIMQYNGKFGCSFCLKAGVEIVRGKGRARIYEGSADTRRTAEQHVQALESLQQDPQTEKSTCSRCQALQCSVTFVKF